MTCHKDSADRFDLNVITDKAVYAAGEPVKISFIIENLSEQEEAVIRFPSGQHYDIWVKHDGKEIWRWSHDKRFIEAFTSIKLSTAEIKVFEVTWQQTTDDGNQAPDGRYIVVAQLTPVPPRPDPVETEIILGD